MFQFIWELFVTAVRSPPEELQSESESYGFETVPPISKIAFSSKNLGNPLPNQRRDSCRSLAAASNGKRIDNGYCWIMYFKRTLRNSTIT
jgi:hypothetical protein